VVQAAAALLVNAQSPSLARSRKRTEVSLVHQLLVHSCFAAVALKFSAVQWMPSCMPAAPEPPLLECISCNACFFLCVVASCNICLWPKWFSAQQYRSPPHESIEAQTHGRAWSKLGAPRGGGRGGNGGTGPGHQGVANQWAAECRMLGYCTPSGLVNEVVYDSVTLSKIQLWFLLFIKIFVKN
jgi:hypothetical protein